MVFAILLLHCSRRCGDCQHPRRRGGGDGSEKSSPARSRARHGRAPASPRPRGIRLAERSVKRRYPSSFSSCCCTYARKRAKKFHARPHRPDGQRRRHLTEALPCRLFYQYNCTRAIFQPPNVKNFFKRKSAAAGLDTRKVHVFGIKIHNFLDLILNGDYFMEKHIS